MKLVFIGKRHPQQRDLIERPYGRFHYLPVKLAALGHEVSVVLCSHNGSPSVSVEQLGVHWIGHDLRMLGLRGLLRKVNTDVRAFRPDWIVGISDAQFGWLARRLARGLGTRLAVDAYDNFEAYMSWNLPLHLLWRRSVRDADLVTAAGPQLAERLQGHRLGGRPVQVVPMAADPDFIPRDRAACRVQLGLPADAPLIGYTGSWARNRGTDVFLQAFRSIRRSRPDLRPVLSGRQLSGMPAEPGVLAMGYLDDRALPPLVAALDVACVITADTRFGRYSYPAKLCEAMACGIPVAATATEPVRWMLGGRTAHLAEPGDGAGLSSCISGLLDAPQADYGLLRDWAHSARLFDAQLRA